MDYLALMACYAAGVISLIFAARNPAAGIITHTFALIGGIYLGIGFMILGAQTDAYSIVRWTGQAETGPVTAMILLLALASPFIVGWEQASGRNSRR